MAGSTKASLFLGLGGIALVAIFLWTVFLSGDPLLTSDLWQLDKSMSSEEAAAWRKKPVAYTAPKLELTPQLNPISISIAHWSRATGFPRSSRFTLEVKNAEGKSVFNTELRLMQKKDEGGSDTVIFEWISDTPAINMLNDYLEIPEAGSYTFHLRPGEQQAGNHSRLQLRLRQQVIRPQWWMLIAGLPMVFFGACIFLGAGFMRMRKVLENRPGTGGKG